MKGWRGFVSVAVLAAGLATARPAHAAFWEDAGWGTLTVLSNVVYMPAKIVYSVLGGITGGFAYALTAGDLDTAEKVWVPSMAGTYVITPSMLKGEDSIAFSGSPDDDSTTTTGSDDQGLEEQHLADG